MRQLLLGCLMLAVAGPFGFAQSNDVLQGTRQLVSYDHGQGVKKAAAPVSELKIISAKHFMWVVFDNATRKTLASGNGTYTLQGDSYVEHDVDPKLIGKDQPFTIRINGDTLVQSGVLSDGLKINERWKKVD